MSMILPTTNDTSNHLRKKISPRRDNDRQSTPGTLYNVNIFRIQEHHFKHNNQKKDFRTQVIVNNNLADILADTGAKISVCVWCNRSGKMESN